MSQNDFDLKHLQSVISHTVESLGSAYADAFPPLSGHVSRNLEEQQVVELEAVLANTSFAHEYALIHLNEVDNHRERNAIYDELERYHDTYAATRAVLESLDRPRLLKFETVLQWQKNAVLRGYRV